MVVQNTPFHICILIKSRVNASLSEEKFPSQFENIKNLVVMQFAMADIKLLFLK